MKRVLLIFTGGTLWMRPTDAESFRSVALAPEATREAHDISVEVPSLARLADYDVHRLFHLDSVDMTPAHWVAIAEAVMRGLADYDGVVVGHGTDTMAYTASAVALMLGPIDKPVVFTGAQRPLVAPRSDGRLNLIDAVTVATADVPEVSIVFGSKAFRAVCATKRDARSIDAFDSPACAPLVELGVDVAVADHVLAPSPRESHDFRLDPHVAVVRVIPGFGPSALDGALATGARGIVLEGYGSGAIPSADSRVLARLAQVVDSSVPVVVASQCYRGFVDLERYEGGRAARAAGVLAAGAMTTETAVAKLMVGLGRGLTGSALRDYFERDVVGEQGTLRIP